MLLAALICIVITRYAEVQRANCVFEHILKGGVTGMDLAGLREWPRL